MRKCISKNIRLAADKIAMPWVRAKGSDKAVDFYIELLDSNSLEALIEDLKSGKTIHLPENIQEFKTINKSDFDLDVYNDLVEFLERYRGKRFKETGKYWYDHQNHAYKRRY